MSLADSLKAFKTERADAVTRNLPHARHATTTPTPRTATPEPSDTKRTYDAAFPSSSTSTSNVAQGEMMKQVVTAVDYLKGKDSSQPIPFPDLIRYLSLPVDLQSPSGQATVKSALRTHHRLQYLGAKESPNGRESFRYRPLHPVTNGEELRNYLARLETAQGVSVKELRDGWPDCVPTIDRLASEGYILVSRHKKDGTPNRVYPDNPSYHITTTNHNSKNPTTDTPKVAKLDDAFITFWSHIRLPANETDIRTELERAGLTPTNAVREAKPVQGKKKERKRVDRKNAKKTNVHMAGVLKDYSKLKAAGGPK